MHTQTQSQQIYKRLCEVIPGGVNSPARAFKGLEQSPLVADHAAKDMVFDADGNSYIDYCGSWGPLLHGHAHPEILEVVQNRMAKGITFGITSGIEEKLARKITQLVPSVEKVRFVSSGTEATMSAVRLARGFTKRDLVVKFSGNYHGHADLFLVQAGSGLFGMNATSTSAGIPDEVLQHTACLPYNDSAILRAFLLEPENRDRIAAVIVEPVAGNMGCVPASLEFLRTLRETTLEIGALLIFDEVITGFRIGLGGAQTLYQITPDLTCFGKIIGGGFPAAAFGGSAEIMDHLAPLGPVYQAGTLSGNPVAMEAGLKTLELAEAPGFYEELERKANILTKPVKEILEKRNINACLQQMGSMFTLFFGLKKVSNMEEAHKLNVQEFARFFRYMFSHGVYIPPSQYEVWFVSSVHDAANLNKTCELILNFFNDK